MSLLRRFLNSRHAPLITHGSLVALLFAEFCLILWAPLWAALAPCVLIQHRVGILLHEYAHGIPFRRYRHSLWVLSAVDGLLINFGAVEIFRGTHLAHHRWLNTQQDPGYWNEPAPSGGRGPSLLRRLFCTLRGDIALYLRFPFRAAHAHYAYVKGHRVLLGAGLSLIWVVVCAGAGLARVPGALLAVQLCLIFPLSLRAVIEHTSWRGDENFANEYRVWLPMFNRNRHVHHHLEPARPWYLLRFCTPSPLPPLRYWTHWYHVFVKQDYVLMSALSGSFAIKEKHGVTPDSDPDGMLDTPAAASAG